MVAVNAGIARIMTALSAKCAKAQEDVKKKHRQDIPVTVAVE